MDSDFWLIKAFVFCDLAFIAFALALILYSFPKRIRTAIAKNSVRLDGTRSARRLRQEKSEFQLLMINTLVVLLVGLVLANVVVFVVHREVIPLPIVVASMEQFHVDGYIWANRLLDPAQGNISHRYDEWLATKNMEHQVRIENVIYMFPVTVVFGCLFVLGTGFCLARLYIRSLAQFEKNIQRRHREYLNYDMKSRFNAVEAAKTRKTPEAKSTPSV